MNLYINSNNSGKQVAEGCWYGKIIAQNQNVLRIYMYTLFFLSAELLCRIEKICPEVLREVLLALMNSAQFFFWWYSKWNIHYGIFLLMNFAWQDRYITAGNDGGIRNGLYILWSLQKTSCLYTHITNSRMCLYIPHWKCAGFIKHTANLKMMEFQTRFWPVHSWPVTRGSQALTLLLSDMPPMSLHSLIHWVPVPLCLSWAVFLYSK